jgi:hypothetical protein
LTLYEQARPSQGFCFASVLFGVPSAIGVMRAPGKQTCSIGLGNTTLYEATRHYFAWYLLSVSEMPDHIVAQQLRHDDAGTLVRELYGHPDAAIARERIRAAFREATLVTALPLSSRPPVVGSARVAAG